MSDAGRPPISKIKRLHIRNFRGFVGHHNLDTDADLVLITGPNGYGKSSLLEAVTLLLTGWHWPHPFSHGTGGTDLVSLKTAVDDDMGFQLVADLTDDHRSYAKSSDNPIIRIELDGKNDMPGLPTWVKENEQRDERVERFRLLRGRDIYVNRELPARLTAFFQDRIDQLFDEVAKGETLRDIYEPLLPAVEALAKPEGPDLLGKAWNILETRRKDIQLVPSQSRAKVNNRLALAFKALRPVYLELATHIDEWPDAVSTPEAISDDEALDAWVKLVLKSAQYPQTNERARLRRDFRQAVTSEIERQLKNATERAAGATNDARAIEKELDRIVRDIIELDREFPNLEVDVGLFVASKPDQPDAPTIFRALADNAERWSRARVPAGQVAKTEVTRFRRALEELAKVVPDQARQCAQAIEDWWTPRRRAFFERERLIKTRNKLRTEFERALTSVEVNVLKERQRIWNAVMSELEEPWRLSHQLRDWEEMETRRRNALDRLTSAQLAINWSRKEILDIVRPGTNRELMCAVQQLANTVLRRFTLVDGVLPLRLDDGEELPGPARDDEGPTTHRRSYRVLTRDGRTLSQLSTGQRAQIAVALLTSQNLAATRYLSHGVLVLDDVTTAYDLSNLTREAILWRQLAYGEVPESHRRQVFISSHHEDMTNHLVDLLVPPEGKRMHVIRFTGWTPDDGPMYDIFNVTPTRAAGTATKPGAGRLELGRDLADF